MVHVSVVLEYHNTVVQQYEGGTAAVVRRGEHRSYLTYYTHVTGLTPPGSSWGDLFETYVFVVASKL